MIRQRPSSKHVPIIFVTAFSDEMHAARGYSLGAVDYIQAPVLPEVLRTKVAVFVDLFRKTLQLRRQTESLRDHAAQLQKLAAASVVINSAMSLPQMLQTIADSARTVLGTHQAIMLYLGDPNARPARPTAIGSFSDRYRDWRERPLDIAAVAQTVVARSRTATRMTDQELHAHPDWDIVSNLVIPPITNGMLAAPLCGRDGSNLGVIYVTDPRHEAFTGDDEAILVQLAQMGSIAIENTIYSQEREANRTKDEFLATLSHELRTPLNAILGWTELMKTESMNAEVGHAFEVIDRNARAQATLIEDLLEVSRITSGKLRLSPRTMDLPAVITAATEAVRPAAEAKRIHIECEVASLPNITGDPDRLQQVVWNLLSNAVKFTRDGGSVTVRATFDDASQAVQVAVQDTGQGISREFLPHVFERFRQADSSSTRKHGGLGIGLTIVRQIVQLHGGTVDVRSDGVGLGSTFTFVVPCCAVAHADATPDEADAAVTDAAAHDVRDLRVLLVDDDDDAREVVVSLLRRHGITVTTAASVAAAMQRLSEQPPDLIVSDISMPDEDGYDLIRRLGQYLSGSQRRIPAIALTAHARPADRERMLAAGYHDHIAKPVNTAELVAAIRRAMLAAPVDAPAL
jgi:signal transduction histidine kinase/ActR/RegA family two-component response regulator